jgi:hypothetical protein
MQLFISSFTFVSAVNKFRPQAAILRCRIMPNLLHSTEYCPFHKRVTEHLVIKMLQFHSTVMR